MTFIVSCDGADTEITAIWEANNYGFYVQRKRQSESTWTDLPNSFIGGHGTTTVPQQYSFTDISAAGGNSYRLKQVDLNGTQHFSEPIHLNVVTSVREEQPLTFALLQNYPNPFNPATVVSYQVPVAGKDQLVVYDMLGREVSVLVDEKKGPGSYEAKFDATGLSSGVYFYRMHAGDFVQARKLLLVR